MDWPKERNGESGIGLLRRPLNTFKLHSHILPSGCRLAMGYQPPEDQRRSPLARSHKFSHPPFSVNFFYFSVLHVRQGGRPPSVVQLDKEAKKCSTVKAKFDNHFVKRRNTIYESEIQPP